MANIFDEAAQGSVPSHKVKPKTTDSSSTSNPFFNNTLKEEKKLEEFNPATMTLQDVNQMLEQVRKMHDDLDRQLDDIFQKSGLSPQYIKSFLNNPNNFTPKQWTHLEQHRAALLDSLKPEKEKKGASATNKKNPELSEEALEKIGKERRGKTLGARRNWIPMR